MDFNKWTDRIAADLKNLPDDERTVFLETKDLTEVNGTLMARCCKCDNLYEIDWNPKEHDPDYSFCGSSEYCLP